MAAVIQFNTKRIFSYLNKVMGKKVDTGIRKMENNRNLHNVMIKVSNNMRKIVGDYSDKKVSVKKTTQNEDYGRKCQRKDLDEEICKKEVKNLKIK